MHQKEGRVFQAFAARRGCNAPERGQGVSGLFCLKGVQCTRKRAGCFRPFLLEGGAMHQKEGRVFQAFAARRGCNAPERRQGVSGLCC